MKQPIRLALALAAALLFGIGAGYALMAWAPCRWFGSSFEGGCGFGALGWAFVLGIVVCAASFVILMRAFSERTHQTPLAGSSGAPKLIWTWLLLLILQYAVPIAIFMLGWPVVIERVASWIVLAAFVATSALLAGQRSKHPAASLLALVPMIGPLIVATVMFLPSQMKATGK